MKSKLTLSMDKLVIKKAKEKLQTKDQSLSKLAENYFRTLLAINEKQNEDTPLVKELSGIARMPKGKNKRDIIVDYLLEKYK